MVRLGFTSPECSERTLPHPALKRYGRTANRETSLTEQWAKCPLRSGFQPRICRLRAEELRRERMGAKNGRLEGETAVTLLVERGQHGYYRGKQKSQ